MKRGINRKYNKLTILDVLIKGLFQEKNNFDG